MSRLAKSTVFPNLGRIIDPSDAISRQETRPNVDVGYSGHHLVHATIRPPPLASTRPTLHGWMQLAICRLIGKD